MFKKKHDVGAEPREPKLTAELSGGQGASLGREVGGCIWEAF